MKSLIVSLCVFAVANAFAKVDIRDGVLTFNVESGEDTYSEAIGSDIVKVVKTGGGTGILTVASPDFKGETSVEGGILQVTTSSVVCGNKGDRISVAKGAQFRVAFAEKLTSATYFKGDVEIAGAGPDGSGAIYVVNNQGNYDKLFQSVKLMGGSAVGGTGRWGSLAWDLNACTLTNLTSNQFVLDGATVKNAGNIVHNGSSSITFISHASTFDGDESNVLKPVHASASLSFWQTGSMTVPWTLDLREFSGTSAFLYKSYGTEEANRKTAWTGPVLLGSKLLYFARGATAATTAYPNVAGSIYGENGQGTVGQSDPMTTTLSGDVHAFGSLDPVLGSMTVTGGVSHTYNLILPDNRNGNNAYYKYRTLRFVDAAGVAVTNAGTSVVNVRSGIADGYLPSRLEFDGKTFVTNAINLNWYVGFKTNRWGVVKVTNGASVTNVVLQTGVDSGIGALYVKDSSFHSNAGPGYDGKIAFYNGTTALGNSYGYWGMSNSTVLVDGYTTVALSKGTTGFLVQHGGVHKYKGSTLRLGHGGYAHYRIGDRGLFDHSCASFLLGSTYPSGWSQHLAGGTTVLSVADGAEAFVSELSVYARTNGVSQLNLSSGGRIRTVSGRRGVCGQEAVRPSGATFRVSFDGGIFHQAYNGKSFYFDNTKGDIYDGRPTQMIVHDGGALIEVDAGKTAYWNAPLAAPTGKVIKSIAMPTDAEFVASTNIGPMRVEIEGSGSGASAFVAFDDAAEKLDRVIIDSPGTGYDETTTAMAVSPVTGKRYACAVTLADAVGGGLVKLGPGMLQLETVNAYAGATVVSNGTVKMTIPGSVPNGHALHVAAGASFDSWTNELSVTTLSGAGGMVASGTHPFAVDEFKPQTADVQTNGCLTVNVRGFSLGAVDLSDLDVTQLDESKRYTLASFTTALDEVPEFVNIPENWGVRLSSDGKRIETGFRHGLLLLVR